ncbi:hypothetical protein TRAPUB_11682 [Trametes pubescens]|uniref:Uncharacterized protein n=1 Tax=Trametes pubescens TaxID=154538 RepID=A0A1M2VW79_TRAPU|nr:hypothetical protein TRAPUB_11682 [Trametes pubescens]
MEAPGALESGVSVWRISLFLMDRWGPEPEGWSLPKRYGARWENARRLTSQFAKIRKHETRREWKREKTGGETPEYELSAQVGRRSHRTETVIDSRATKSFT